MRFTIAVAGAFAAVAVAQSPSASATQAASQTVSLSPVQSSMMACLDKCEPGDVACESPCIAVPAPNEDQVNKTTECVADCDKFKANGTETDIQRYTECRDGCISEHYYEPSQGTPSATGGSNSGNNSDAPSGTQTSGASRPNSTGGSDSEGATSSGSDNPTNTDSAPANSDSPGAASHVAGSSVAFFGLLVAALAL